MKNSQNENEIVEKDSNRAYQEELFRNRESLQPHSRYGQEKKINAMIAAGDADKLRSMMQPVQDKHVGQMSRNPFRQQLYGVIVGIAVATRAAMNGGLNEEEAYTLSDIYIREADSCNMPDQLWDLYVRMIVDFAERVREAKKDTSISDTIQVSMDYILNHLHYDTPLKEIADHAGLSETYFSALFKKETGETVSEFIQKSRVKEAQSLLQYSEYSLMEIGEYLGFCSQSHFSKTFRRFTGVTPGQYRKQYFKRSW